MNGCWICQMTFLHWLRLSYSFSPLFCCTVLAGIVPTLQIPAHLELQDMISFVNRVFVGVIKLKWSYTGLKWVLIQRLVSLWEEGNLGTDIQNEECHVKMEPATGAVCLHTKGYEEFSQSRRARREVWDRFSLRTSSSNKLCWCLDLELITFRTLRD